MKRFSLWQLGALAGVLACVAPIASLADDYDKKTIVTISQRTEVPGIILEPGTYVIKLLNSSSNRHIAEIMNERMDHLYALTFTAAAEKVTRTGKTVLTFYEGTNDRPPALRKWFWPGDTIGQEFIYPKDQAARISAATKERVPEGNLPTVAESGQKLTPDNANGLAVTEKTEIISEQKPVVLEERKQEATAAVAVAAEPVRTPEPAAVVAQNTPPRPPPQRVVEPEPAPVPTAVQETASVDSAKTLPQTASPLPLIGLMGGVSLALALVVGFFRRRSTSSL